MSLPTATPSLWTDCIPILATNVNAGRFCIRLLWVGVAAFTPYAHETLVFRDPDKELPFLAL